VYRTVLLKKDEPKKDVLAKKGATKIEQVNDVKSVNGDPKAGGGTGPVINGTLADLVGCVSVLVFV